VPPLPATARRASAAGGARTGAPDRSTVGGTGPASIGGGNCGEGHADLPPDLPATARTPRLRAVAGRNRTLPPTRLRAHHPWGTRALRHHGRTRGPRPRRDPRLHGKPDHVRVGSPAAGAGDALDPVAPGGRRPLTAGLEQPILHTERRRTGSGAAWAEVGGGPGAPRRREAVMRAGYQPRAVRTMMRTAVGAAGRPRRSRRPRSRSVQRLAVARAAHAAPRLTPQDGGGPVLAGTAGPGAEPQPPCDQRA
jgi:hypothetical protein